MIDLKMSTVSRASMLVFLKKIMLQVDHAPHTLDGHHGICKMLESLAPEDQWSAIHDAFHELCIEVIGIHEYPAEPPEMTFAERRAYHRALRSDGLLWSGQAGQRRVALLTDCIRHLQDPRNVMIDPSEVAK